MSKKELIFFLLSKRGYLKKSATYLADRFNVDKDLTKQALKEACVIDKANVSMKSIWGKPGNENASYELIENLDTKEVGRIAKKAQRQSDINTVERKLWRKQVRAENALFELTTELRSELRNKGLKIKKYTHYPSIKGDVLVVQLSDTHFNELVDLPNNHYDFIVAAKRLQKYAEEIKLMYMARGAKKIVIAMTGDLINSNRRMDEILAMATSRAKATLLASHLLAYFINDLNSVADVDVAYVTGNESRIDEEWGLNHIMASDNFDTIIFNILRLLFKDNPGVKFIEGDPTEMVIQVQGVNILLLHGTTLKRDTQASIQQVMGKYANKDILIKYVLFGHVHFANITDIYARSGSLVGNNVYSDRGINLVTRASQVMHFVSDDTSISNLRVDLQFTDKFKGYPIEDDIKAYDAKATTKLFTLENTIQVIT